MATGITGRPRFLSTEHPLLAPNPPPPAAPKPEDSLWTGPVRGLSDTEHPTLQSGIQQLSVMTFPGKFVLSGLQANVISGAILGFGSAVLGESVYDIRFYYELPNLATHPLAYIYPDHLSRPSSRESPGHLPSSPPARRGRTVWLTTTSTPRTFREDQCKPNICMQA